MTIGKITINDAIPFGLAVVLVILVLMIGYFSFSDLEERTKTRRDEEIPIPTLIPEDVNVPDKVYNERTQNRLLEKIENRTPLSADDITAKNKILSNLPVDNDSGVIYENENIRIDYTKGQDLFQVEILTTKINEAKAEGNDWFLSQGMSQQGICDLPVDFYLNWDVRDELRGKIVSFDSLATGCQ